MDGEGLGYKIWASKWPMGAIDGAVLLNFLDGSAELSERNIHSAKIRKEK
jgi:hypothetical protein